MGVVSLPPALHTPPLAQGLGEQLSGIMGIPNSVIPYRYHFVVLQTTKFLAEEREQDSIRSLRSKDIRLAEISISFPSANGSSL